MKYKKAELYDSEILKELMESIPADLSAKIGKKMLLAVKLDDAMIAKGWKKKDLMKAMGKKNPSEISKWLSGTHNFTVDTLVDLELALGIKLIDVDSEQDQIVYEYHHRVSQEIDLSRMSYIIPGIIQETEVYKQKKSYKIVSEKSIINKYKA